jgi:hypothetical protein
MDASELTKGKSYKVNTRYGIQGSLTKRIEGITIEYGSSLTYVDKDRRSGWPNHYLFTCIQNGVKTEVSIAADSIRHLNPGTVRPLLKT